MARAVGRPSGIRTCRAHCQRTRPHHWRSHSTQSGPRRLGVANESDKPSTISGFKLLIRCVLAAALPGFAVLNSVLPRDGPKHRGPVVWRRRKSWAPPPVHQTQHHHPARARAERHHPGVVGEPAAGCIPSVPPVGGWGRLGASSWPQIRRCDRRRCYWRISGPPPGGPETRWTLPVECCPSKRVVVIHCARPYTAQKASGGCVRAISGNRSCLRRMHSLTPYPRASTF